MTTSRSKLFVLALTAVLGAVLAYATASVASSSPYSEERLKLARQYIASVPVEDEVKAAVDALSKNIREDQRVLFRSLAESSIDYARLRAAAELATAEIFTEDEIKAMIEFFGSDTGKAIRKKLPQYEARIQPVLTEVLHKFVVKLQENNVTLDMSGTGALPQ